MDRRQALKLTAASLAAGAAMVRAQTTRTAPAPAAARTALLDKVSIYIPAGLGGGWDQTGRAFGAAMLAEGLVKEITYENKGGKAGTLGLADFVGRYRTDPTALFVAGLTLVSGITLHRSTTTMKDLLPLARLTGDYMVMAVSPNSRFSNIEQLVQALRTNPAQVTFSGGSAGGTDHMLVGMLMRAVKADLNAMHYEATAGGGEAIEKVRANPSLVLVAGYSELKDAIERKQLVPLAVSARKATFGIPSLRDLGIDTELTNWRGVFASSGLKQSEADTLNRLVTRAAESASWQRAVQDNLWVRSPLAGRDFNKFVEFEAILASNVISMLKIK